MTTIIILVAVVMWVLVILVLACLMHVAVFIGTLGRLKIKMESCHE